MASQIPPDKVNLKLILVSGKTKEFRFSPSDSVSVITQHVYDNWPEEKLDSKGFKKWSDEQHPPTNILRLIYQGRFLHGSVTLGGLQLATGRTTVMHMVARETLPEPNSQSQMKKDKNGEQSSCCIVV